MGGKKTVSCSNFVELCGMRLMEWIEGFFRDYVYPICRKKCYVQSAQLVQFNVQGGANILWDVGWVDYNLDVPPCCLLALPIMPNSRLVELSRQCKNQIQPNPTNVTEEMPNSVYTLIYLNYLMLYSDLQIIWEFQCVFTVALPQTSFF